MKESLTVELLQRLESLSLQEAIFPASEPAIDRTVEELEELNSIYQPLSDENQSLLLGEWELIYASRGTVVTRQFATIPDWTRIEIKRVWQNLIASDIGTVKAFNCAKIELPLLGEWKIQAEGIWTSEKNKKTASVSFNAFSFQINKPLCLPELKIPVLEFLRNQAVWITSYLDEKIRVGRGATGNLFVFLRK